MAILSETTSFINAGGRGTRLMELPEFSDAGDKGVAKALLANVAGKLIIDYHVARSLDQSYSNIVVSVGDQTGVAEYLHTEYGDNDKISIISTPSRFGTARDLLMSLHDHPNLFADNIMVTNCDTIIDVDEQDVVKNHIELNSGALIVLTKAVGVQNEGAYSVDEQTNKVISSEEFEMFNLSSNGSRDLSGRFSSCGSVCINKEVLLSVADDMPSATTEEVSIYRHLLSLVHFKGQLFGYDNGTNFFLDIGLPETYKYFYEHPEILNLKRKEKIEAA
jgi:NDP-sugar pyrophosphorylase family protein